MNKHYIRDHGEEIHSDFDETTRFGEAVGLVIGFAFLLIFLAWCATTPAHADTIAAPTRASSYDWACLDASGAVLSTHQRFDTAFVACYNNPAGDRIQGGTYKLAARGTTPPVTCPPAPASTTRTQQCPAGTTGSWQQTSASTVGAPPACTVATSWAPVDAPAGACVPAPPVPSAPTGLAASIAPNASNPGNSNVTLTWQAVAGVDKYECHRCTGATCTNFGYVAPDATATSWLNQNLPPGLTYRYKCRAFAPVTGPFSDILNVTTPTATQPPPQANGSATVQWEYDGGTIDGFRVVYGLSADALLNSVQVDAAARSVVVDKLTSGKWYFAPRAFNSGGESANGLTATGEVASKVIP